MIPIPWFKVDDSFGTHPKVLSIPRGAPRIRAIGLWTAVGNWCARHLTDGHFPAHMVDELGGTKADTRRLVDARLWETTDQGLLFHDWADWQPTKAAVEAEREKARERMRRARKQRGTSDGVRPNSGRSSGAVTVTPSRPDPTNAAAAASDEPLPPPVEILRQRLEAHHLVVRWDQLTSDQLDEITDLIEIHGDAALVKHAKAAFRPDAPASFAQAWLSGWRNLTPPGAGLRAVDPPCPEPGHSGTTHHCTQCASEHIERTPRKARP